MECAGFLLAGRTRPWIAVVLTGEVSTKEAWFTGVRARKTAALGVKTIRMAIVQAGFPGMEVLRALP